jgi:hypothetical protein
MADRTDAPRAVWAFAEHEHRDLVHGINRLHDYACDVSSWATPDLSAHLKEIIAWVERDLEPHIAWEESWLYPEIDARTGSPWATRAARFDHAQIRTMAGRLKTDRKALIEGVAHEHLAEVRCHMFGLEALLRAHVEREERYLIPLLADDVSIASSDPTPVGALTAPGEGG